MHKVTFFPLGNADTTLIELSNDSLLLFDYAATANTEDDEEKRVDLPAELQKILQEKETNTFSVVAFTHADTDHLKKFHEFFYLEHAAKYQSDDRPHIKELWIPAALLLETGLELSDEHKILRTEVRYRLKHKLGIRIFSDPEKLREWIEQDGTIAYEDAIPHITEAGNLVPGWTIADHGVEFFVHAPFAEAVDGEEIDRNTAALVLHATFEVDGEQTKLMLTADNDSDVWNDIVKYTNYKGNKVRLEWDIYKISHHCSYKSLNKEEKGEKKTVPVDSVAEVLSKGNAGGILISPSNVILDEDADQPPHFQAKNAYLETKDEISGAFYVTMEYPTSADPQPLVIVIDSSKARVQKKTQTASFYATSSRAPRAG